MVMVLEKTMLDEIVRIGRDRAPSEACGIILPEPVRNRWVWECANRSETPHDSFTMTGKDIIMLLERIYEDPPAPEMVAQMVVWHTHPKGGVGPSTFDLQNKPAKLRCLVVSLGDNPLATWY